MRAKYAALLDPEVQAYLARCDALYPPDAVDLDIAGQRRVYDAMCAAFDRERPAHVTTRDAHFDDVPCRVYETGIDEATVVYYHGGGFVVGGLHSHDSICAEICDQTGFRVVSVDYPLAPESIYPADFEASLAAYLAIRRQWAGCVLLCGDSAGGNLAAALSGRLRGQVTAPGGQVLIYPGLGGDRALPSYTEHADAPQLSLSDLNSYAQIRCGGTPPVGDPCYAPLQDADFKDLPQTLVFSAECDPLASDGEAYCAAIRAAGGQAVWVNEPGLVHGYLRARSMSAKAAASFERICKGLREMGAIG